MNTKPAAPRAARRRPDPITRVLRRLLAATDRSIKAADEVRRARVELAKLVEGADDEA